MQEFIGFFASVIIISASGVMSPGPLFAGTISNAMRFGRSVGLKIAVGHTLVELPLVAAIGIGVISLETLPEFRTIISVFGALSVFVFAGLQIRSALRQGVVPKETRYGALATGILLTGLNPFFLVWWFTIGVKLISDALLLWSLWGILIMFVLHVWMDYAWLFFVSSLSSSWTRLLSNKGYKICMIAVNLVLVYFGASFILDVI